MRLPDLGDRELVGKAANLNDDQISELAKLPCGVAAIYQNEWVQPVLCKIKEFTAPIEKYQYTLEDDTIYDDSMHSFASQSLLDCIMNKEIFSKDNRTAIRQLKDVIMQSKLSTAVKCDFIEYINADKENALPNLRALVYDFFQIEPIIIEAINKETIEDAIQYVIKSAEPSLQQYSNKQIGLVLTLMFYEHAERNQSFSDFFCRFIDLYKEKGGIL